MGANRFLISYAGDAGQYSRDPIYAYLSETVHALRLRLPPLSRRRDDIPTLVTLYINATNVRFGTRVIGLTREAMLLLQNFPWPHNIDQLVKCVQELVVNTDSSYISDAQVRAVLERETTPPPPRRRVLTSTARSPISRGILCSGSTSWKGRTRRRPPSISTSAAARSGGCSNNLSHDKSPAGQEVS